VAEKLTIPPVRPRLLGQLLTNHLRVLGSDHLYTLKTRYALACWRNQASRDLYHTD
jgi:hypothetical protein